MKPWEVNWNQEPESETNLGTSLTSPPQPAAAAPWERDWGGEVPTPAATPQQAAPSASVGDILTQEAKETYRTIGGGLGDFIGNTSNFLVDTADFALRNNLYNIPEAVGDEANYNKAVADLKAAGNFIKSVPAPDSTLNNIIRGTINLGAGMVAPSRVIATEAPAIVPAVRGLISGAVSDFTATDPNAPNLGNLVEEKAGVTIPTAKREGDSPWLRRLKDVAEGGFLGSAGEVVLNGIVKAAGKTAKSIKDFRASDLDTNTVDNILVDPDTRRLLEANGVFNPEEPGYQDAVAKATERLTARRAAESERAQLPPNTDQNLVRREQEAVDFGMLDPGAKRTANAVREVIPPGKAVEVTPEGIARASTDAERGIAEGIKNTDNVRADIDANAQEAFRVAEVMQRRGPEYREMRSSNEADYVSRQEYEALAKRIGEDPGSLVETQFKIPRDQFVGLAPDARERLVQAAQRQRSAETPSADIYRTTDDNLAKGEGFYSPSTKPNVSGSTGVQPTKTELEVSGGKQPYYRMTSGTSDRPFVAKDKIISDEQTSFFENKARAQADDMRKASVDDLYRKWEEKAREKTSDGKSRFADAENFYKSQKQNNAFSNKPSAPDIEKRYPVDKYGFVKSDKGGPVRFADQKQAARWIVSKGHKDSPDQIFEIENHPSGKGFTVRERGRTTTESAGAEKASATSNPATDGAGETRTLSSPIEARTDTPSGAPGAPEKQSDSVRSGGETPSPKETVAPKPDQVDPGPGKNEPKPETTESNEWRVADPQTKPTGKVGESEAAKPKPGEEPVGLKEKTEAKTEDKPSNFSSTFYSNPLDPNAAKELLGVPLARTFQKEKQAFMKDLNSLRETFGGERSPNKKSVGQSIADFGRVIWHSNRAVMRMIGDRYPAVKEVKELTDMLATNPGSTGGRTVKQTFEEAVEQRSVSQLNRLMNIVGDKKDDSAFLDRVADILSGRAKSVDSREGIVASRIRKLLDEEHTYLTKSGVELGYVKNSYYPRTIDKIKVIEDPKTFMQAAENIYSRMGIPSNEAKIGAEEWYHRVLGIGQNKHTIGDYGPSNSFTKGRVLPKEADTIMKEFYVNDVFENLSGYFRQAARRGEFTARFGKNGEIVDKMFDEMLRKGMKAQDVQMMRDAFDSATGNLTGTSPGPLKGFASWVQTMGTISLLPRAVISSIPEALAAGIRSHSTLNGLQAFFDGWKAVFKSTDMEDQRAAAEIIGVIGDATQQMFLSARFGGGMDSKLQSRIMAQFFERTGLHQITEGQRIAAMKIGQKFVGTLVNDIKAGKRVESSKLLLSELGIGGDDVAKLTKWLEQNNGVPKVRDLIGDSEEVNLYRSAIGRFVDESIQNPKAVDRPQLANHPVGRMMYGIMSFMYAYTRNVLLRTGKNVATALKGELDTGAKLTAADRIRLAGVLPAFAMVVGGQMGVSRLREALFNPDAQKERDELQRFLLDMSRSGLTGTFDPIMNAILSVKYERDLSNIVVGANLGFFMDRLGKIAGLWPQSLGGKNSPNTNNAEWSATRAAYQMFVTPAAMTALSLAPGGPLLKTGYGALMIGPLSAPQTGRSIADSVVGKRDIEPKTAAKSPQSGTERSSGRNSTRKSTRPSTR